MKFSLQELCAVINEREPEMVEREVVEYHGTVYRMDQLPIEGADITDTEGVYSWDDTHMLVCDGTYSGGMSVEPRSQKTTK